MTDDLIARSKFTFPVYAAGYDWLASNQVLATALQKRIGEIINENNGGQFRCEQVKTGPRGSGSVTETSYWELHGEMHDGNGDGTVPTSSGRPHSAPRHAACSSSSS